MLSECDNVFDRNIRSSSGPNDYFSGSPKLGGSTVSKSDLASPPVSRVFSSDSDSECQGIRHTRFTLRPPSSAGRPASSAGSVPASPAAAHQHFPHRRPAAVTTVYNAEWSQRGSFLPTSRLPSAAAAVHTPRRVQQKFLDPEDSAEAASDSIYFRATTPGDELAAGLAVSDHREQRIEQSECSAVPISTTGQASQSCDDKKRLDAATFKLRVQFYVILMLCVLLAIAVFAILFLLSMYTQCRADTTAGQTLSTNATTVVAASATIPSNISSSTIIAAATLRIL